MKKKLVLSNVKVKSFQINHVEESAKTIKGGAMQSWLEPEACTGRVCTNQWHICL